MSKLSLVRDEQFQKHSVPDSHPESPQRLAAIDRAFHKHALRKEIKELAPKMASEDDIAAVHNPCYVEDLQKGALLAGKGQFIQLDCDTFMGAESFDTAKLAAGAGIVAVDSIADGGFNSSFVSVRPPGHHAMYERPMGFCLFNNIAIAARYAQKKMKAKRILILDWDVHHGNGTQAMFYNDPSVLFISLHQYPFWPPDSGWLNEDGAGAGKGFNVNIPLPAGTGDRGYVQAWDRIVAPIAHQYAPDLVLVSAGYDAHLEDPLAQQRLTTAGFTRLAQRLMVMAETNKAKVVSFLEGGYNVSSLADSAIATMRVMNADVSGKVKEDRSKLEESQDQSPNRVSERIEEIVRHQSKYWQVLRK